MGQSGRFISDYLRACRFFLGTLPVLFAIGLDKRTIAFNMYGYKR